MKEKEIWFVTGSQHLYGPETLAQVAKNSQTIVDGFNASVEIPVKIVYKPTVKTPSEITDVCQEASADRNHHLDAYVFTGKNVDQRFVCTYQAFMPLTYPI